jgi:hypothetical protein
MLAVLTVEGAIGSLKVMLMRAVTGTFVVLVVLETG